MTQMDAIYFVFVAQVGLTGIMWAKSEHKSAYGIVCAGAMIALAIGRTAQ
jgi:hypothetical protein